MSNPNGSGEVHVYLLQGESFVSYVSESAVDCDLNTPDPYKCAQEFQSAILSASFDGNNKLNFMLGHNKRTVNKMGRNWLSGRISYIKSIGNLNFLADINFYNSTSNSSEIKRTNFKALKSTIFLTVGIAKCPLASANKDT